ncbi:MAG: formate C-acetyltransferase [Eubacteriales bacterium]|nr:formate C-acetyltransferase [Eubacteriales bacterium]
MTAINKKQQNSVNNQAKAWREFHSGRWQEQIDVANFIEVNTTEYTGDESFLAPTAEDTKLIWQQANDLIQEEIRNKSIKVDLERFSGIDNFAPGYISEEHERIVGLQTDKPMQRIMNPYGGFRMVENSLKAYGLEMKEGLAQAFNEYRKSHNQGVFDAYTKEMRLARTAGLLTGLPDAYGRGRIIGDYRRVALYGIDFLKKQKLQDLENSRGDATEELIRHREELSEQIRALGQIQNMAARYGFDISRPAETAQEAVQWLYFGYLAAVKENNGAAMSLGRNTNFLDIYIERDLRAGLITEADAQALIDQLIIKLRLVRHLRTPEYDELFAGDPTWVTESIGGMLDDERSLVCKSSFRFLHSLTNLGPSPEPNMTVLWSEKLPSKFKNYCSRMSIETGAIQYENDDLMRPIYGHDYAIACCVSAMQIGKQMQFFGARANLAKALLYAINGGIDEIKKDKVTGRPLEVISGLTPITSEYLDYDEVMAKYKVVLAKLAELYVNTMNTIHYMHDKYAYEAGQMALHDSELHRFMAFGIAGISIVADSLSAIKYAKVKVIRDENGLSQDFEIEGEFPTYGNDDDRVDEIAVELTELFANLLKEHPSYRDSEHTLSLLTITSNVVYGKKTGSTPDGRHAGEAFAPGANPMHGRDQSGALASLNSVAKIPYHCVCQDGISNTFSIIPDSLGKSEDEQIIHLSAILDGYFRQHAFHLNVNVLRRELLLDAMEHPEKYPNLTIRVSGYAVRFNQLSKEQQTEVVNRTFHQRV